MGKAISILLVLVGVIHLMPLSGVLGGSHLSSLYGLAAEEANISILLRHRAVMFGLLGALLVYAAFDSSVRVLAIIGGFVSVLSFLLLAWWTGEYNLVLKKVILADLVALVALCAITALLVWRSIRA